MSPFPCWETVTGSLDAGTNSQSSPLGVAPQGFSVLFTSRSPHLTQDRQAATTDPPSRNEDLSCHRAQTLSLSHHCLPQFLPLHPAVELGRDSQSEVVATGPALVAGGERGPY